MKQKLAPGSGHQAEALRARPTIWPIASAMARYQRRKASLPMRRIRAR